jgi:hypothetical protein
MIQGKLWRANPERVKDVHLWRPRRSRRGELVQWDTSEHDWLEGRGEKLYLIAMIDDATSRLWARFVRHDSTEENMKLLWSHLEKFGHRALDKRSHSLAASLSHVETRQVRNHYTLRFQAQLYQIERGSIVGGLRTMSELILELCRRYVSDEARREFARALERLHTEAAKTPAGKLTMRQIDAEITAARRARRNLVSGCIAADRRGGHHSHGSGSEASQVERCQVEPRLRLGQIIRARWD